MGTEHVEGKENGYVYVLQDYADCEGWDCTERVYGTEESALADAKPKPKYTEWVRDGDRLIRTYFDDHETITRIPIV